jgi:hypothetical protein
MEIRSFLGIRNTNPVRSIPDNALSDAVNVDIDDVGIVSRRNGYGISIGFTNITSAYSTLDQTAYVVADGILYRVLEDLSPIPIVNSIADQFDDFGKVLFTNDGFRIENDVAVNIKLPVANNPPELTLTSGELPEGIYSAAYCYRSATGLESGSSPIATIKLESIGGIIVTAPTPPAGFTTKVYLTEANGTVYYDTDGIQLNPVQILADPYPDNVDLVAYHDSRLWCSQPLTTGQTVIWFSYPFHQHLFDAQKNYMIIPGLVLAMASAGSVLLIGTDSAIYAYDTGLQLLAGYGVVSGRPFTKSVDGTVMIHTKRGVCRAMPFENLTERKALFAPGIQCSTAIVDQDGISKFVVLTDGSGVPYNVRG